jgi:hypothetical protein
MDKESESAYKSAIAPSQSGYAHMTSPTISPPKFDASKPWHVLSFKVDGGKLIVETKDSSGATGALEFNRDDLRLIQYISTSDLNDTVRKLYAEIRHTPERPFGQPPNKIIYLGELNKDEFSLLKPVLEQGGIDYVWYTRPRREKMIDLLPKTWGCQPK